MRYLLIFFAALSGFGQIATTDDGSIILLTSPWHLNSSNDVQPVGQPGWRLFGLRPGSDWQTIAAPGANQTMVAPFLSGDGSVAGWDRHNYCFGSCILATPRSRTEYQGLNPTVKINPFLARISRNKRFLFTPGFFTLTPYELQDLQSGEVWRGGVNAPKLTLAAQSQMPADDGTIIANASEGVVVMWRPGSDPKEILSAQFATPLALSANGRRAVITTREELLLVETSTGMRLASLSGPPVSRPYWRSDQAEISNDGSRVLFFNPLLADQLWWWEEGMQEARRLTAIEEPIQYIALSGNGSVGWVQMRSGRLLRLIITGEDRFEEALPALPLWLRQTSQGTVPGSAVVFESSGPVGSDLQIDATGVQFPRVPVSGRDSLAVQVPWEFPTGEQNISPVKLTVQRPGHPFRLETSLQTYPGAVWPAFSLRPGENGRGFLLAAKQYFEATVDKDHPAIAGETVHAYLFGLGPLDRPIPTGAPGPADPPARPITPIGCYLRGADNVPALRGLVLPLVVYAPALTGIYQVDLKIPEDWPSGDSLVICDAGGRQAGGWIPISGGPVQNLTRN